MSKVLDFLRAGMPGRKKKPTRDPRYGTLNRRMVAATIDSLIIMVLIAPLSDYLFDWFYHPQSFDWAGLQEQIKTADTPQEANQVFFKQMNDSGQMSRWLANSVLQTVILCVCTAVCWHKWSATPGKILLRLRIVDATTEAPMTARQIVLRLLGYVVSSVFLCAGFFWIGIDKRRQGWHDKIAHTVVLLLPKKQKPAEKSDQAL